MMSVLLSLLLFALPAYPSSATPLDGLSGHDICQLVELEILQAIDDEILEPHEGYQIVDRCYINYANWEPS